MPIRCKASTYFSEEQLMDLIGEIQSHTSMSEIYLNIHNKKFMEMD